MDADFSVELGPEDPVLDFPWTDPSGKLAYVDLKRLPELIAQIEEAQTFPELQEFLRTLNSPRCMVETAKCDAWATTELSAEEEVYNASHKSASYVDVVFSNIDARLSSLRQSSLRQSSLRRSLSAHEQFARKLVELLRRAPETPSAAEVCVRRCYFGEEGGVREGFYCTLYVSGYGNDGVSARQNWAVGLKLMGNAIVQLSAAGVG
ncbi:MAG: hypothetical protein ABSA54_13150 [Terriglobales bacterium]|jgi:hypothetical protein